MAEKRAGDVEAFVARPDFTAPILLLYGPDAGLVSERAGRLAAASGIDESDPFATVILAADELEKNIGRLFDEARTVSMFGGRRLVRVRGTGGKALAEAVADLASDPPSDTIVIVEAGELRKSSPLRAAAERGRGAMALPCYQDEARALDRMIDEELRAAALKMTEPARDLLRSRLGADRRASRSEVQKLCLYAYGSGEITDEDVRTVVGDVSAETVDEIIDAAASGEVRKLPALIDRALSSGTPGFLLLQGLLRHFHGLQVMRQAVERAGEPVSRVVERKRPHFRRRPALETALGTWTLSAIGEALIQIEAAVLATRRSASISDALVRQTVLELGVQAARARTRSDRN
ncbi:DNA polymerase III subunit delta [Consotaella salsifontis]|uniref:DNA-directed DNA polymerase n=1 Tax=Consotaella salsifontis TaxID=1365950 RepID=A0A1T4T4W7_9HYPH|nr:DNA polymerase III subunit delta [Consotaella salsifontis]SKA35486.1 DNA polymerase III, delta subunit [Consotaella salsifontis]